jgi:hypothetical protein
MANILTISAVRGTYKHGLGIPVPLASNPAISLVNVSGHPQVSIGDINGENKNKRRVNGQVTMD